MPGADSYLLVGDSFPTYIVPNPRESDEIQIKVTEIFFMEDRKYKKCVTLH